MLVGVVLSLLDRVQKVFVRSPEEGVHPDLKIEHKILVTMVGRRTGAQLLGRFELYKSF